MYNFIDNPYQIFNTDCITGAKTELLNNSIDLIITDPPYGINGDKLHKHYNRNEDYVIDGYTEIPKDEYPLFSNTWIKEAERVLKPGGSIYIVSGYTNLIHVLNALHNTSLQERNHIIWRYNFGVYTEKKFVSSHYHILYYVKPGAKPTFNTYCRYNQSEKADGKSLLYNDLQDVWDIPRTYKPSSIKNKNELPVELIIKMIQYSSNENNIVCDFFAGSFSVIKTAIGLNRYSIGFEINKSAFDLQKPEIEKTKKGFLLSEVKSPSGKNFKNKGQKWVLSDIEKVISRYNQLLKEKKYKKDVIDILCNEFGRGYFSITNILKKYSDKLQNK